MRTTIHKTNARHLVLWLVMASDLRRHLGWACTQCDHGRVIFFDYTFISIARNWALIPATTDVLVTHGPPNGKRDFNGIEHSGCELLLQHVLEVSPKLHVFGHIHGAYLRSRCARAYAPGDMNAATCNEANQPVHPPIVINLEMRPCSPVC